MVSLTELYLVPAAVLPEVFERIAGLGRMAESDVPETKDYPAESPHTFVIQIEYMVEATGGGMDYSRGLPEGLEQVLRSKCIPLRRGYPRLTIEIS